MKTSSLWATVHHGIENLRIHPYLPAYNRCSHWRFAWDMRCVRLPDKRMLSVDPRGIVLPLTRITDSVLLCGPAGITRELSVSAAASLAICRVVARDPDSSLPFKPAGWHLQSDNRPPRDGNNSPGNS